MNPHLLNLCLQVDPKEALKELEAAEAEGADTSFKRLAKINLPEWPYAIAGVIASAAAGESWLRQLKQLKRLTP